MVQQPLCLGESGPLARTTCFGGCSPLVILNGFWCPKRVLVEKDVNRQRNTPEVGWSEEGELGQYSEAVNHNRVFSFRHIGLVVIFTQITVALPEIFNR